MFDISFAELMLVAVVALLVIGPDRLPKVARTLGAYTGRLQRYISQVKEEVNREINFEELQEMQQDIKADVDEAKASIRDGIGKAKQVANEVEHAITDREAVEPNKSKTARKTPAKKPSAKKPAAKKAMTKKVSTKQAAKKPGAATRVTTKRTVAKKTAAKKPVAKKTVSKQAVKNPQ